MHVNYKSLKEKIQRNSILRNSLNSAAAVSFSARIMLLLLVKFCLPMKFSSIRFNVLSQFGFIPEITHTHVHTYLLHVTTHVRRTSFREPIQISMVTIKSYLQSKGICTHIPAYPDIVLFHMSMPFVSFIKPYISMP